MRAQKRSLALSGHRTSLALEPPFWNALEAEARRAGLSLAALVARIDAARPPDQGLASAVRCHALASAEARAAVDASAGGAEGACPAGAPHCT